MIVEIVLDGVAGQTLCLAATQVLCRLDDGTPVCVAADYAPADAGFIASIAGQPDFNRTLRALGVAETVVCECLRTPGPEPGARLLIGPDR